MPNDRHERPGPANPQRVRIEDDGAVHGPGEDEARQQPWDDVADEVREAAEDAGKDDR